MYCIRSSKSEMEHTADTRWRQSGIICFNFHEATRSSAICVASIPLKTRIMELSVSQEARVACITYVDESRTGTERILENPVYYCICG